MTRYQPVQRDPNTKLSRQQQAYVLRWIAEFYSTAWIVDQLKQRYGIIRSPDSIDVMYRYAEKHRRKIQAYRDGYNDQFKDEAFGSRRFTLRCLKEAYDIALKQEDAKAMVAVIKQACELMGHNTPAELEVNHTHSHYGSFEEMLSTIFDNTSPTTITVEAESQALDILPENSTISKPEQ